jgi:hypothetical protein
MVATLAAECNRQSGPPIPAYFEVSRCCSAHHNQAFAPDLNDYAFVVSDRLASHFRGTLNAIASLSASRPGGVYGYDLEFKFHVASRAVQRRQTSADSKPNSAGSLAMVLEGSIPQ